MVTRNSLASSVMPIGDAAKHRVFNTEYLTVWEGAVRSGKTTETLIAWMHYMLVSPEHIFLMSGATQGSLVKNCIDNDFGLIALTGGSAEKRTDRDGNKFIYWLGNKIYYVGSDTRVSYKKIRGLTIGGWYADEINLHHRTFIEEAFRRTIASKDRRHIWTLNPDVPDHWIYTDYTDRYAEQRLKGFRLHHLTMDDNPAITDERKEEIKQQYTGVFYLRYVLGLRVRAEGGCYPSWGGQYILDAYPKNILFTEIGIDVGGTGSASAFAAVGYFKEDGKPLSIVILDEHYDKTNHSTERLVSDFKGFAERVKKRWRLVEAFVDSAEQLIMRSMRNLAVCNVRGSRKVEVNERIRFTDVMMSRGRFYVMRECKRTINAIESATWNPKANADERLDDGTTNIDSLDAMEYGYERRIGELL